MHPNGSSEDGLDEWEVFQKVTDTSRANIVADIVGHPKGAPSVKELDAMNPSLKADTVRGHLRVLEGVGVVEEIVIPVGERRREYPYKFYQLTTAARELFERNDLFPERAWKREYDRVIKEPAIRELERMPRPDRDSERDGSEEELAAD